MDTREQYGPWTLIAGGSEGIGAAFARKLAAKGINLVLLARKPEPLELVAREVRERWGVLVRTLSVDLSADDMLTRIRELTDDVEVGLLIYNAGAEGTIGDFLDRDLASSERMIGLNVTGPTRLVHHFGSAMRKRRRGGIILTGTSAGYVGAPRIALYVATKVFDRIFAEALWNELAPYNIHVLGLMLGATRTPAAERMGMQFDAPGFVAADPEVVAQEGLDHLGVEPVWHAAGTEAFAQHLQRLGRVEAINLLAEATKSVTR